MLPLPPNSNDTRKATEDETETGRPVRPVASFASGTAKTAGQKAPVRAINEDDDGYDPYTDWHDRRSPEPLFERDPWN